MSSPPTEEEGGAARDMSRSGKIEEGVETLQQKCDECHSKSRVGESGKIFSLETAISNLRKGVTATVARLDQFVSYQKKEHAQLGEVHNKVDFMRDELTAWEVYRMPRESRTDY